MIGVLRNISAKQTYELLLSIAIGIFCFAPNAISPIVLLLLLFVFTQAIRGKMRFQFSKVSLWFIAFFLCYVLGAFFTDHLHEATKNIERRLVYLLFPILFSFQFTERIRLKPIVIGFIIGVIICCLLGLKHSYFNYQAHGDFNNSFGASIFSYIHHPTYLSSFLVFAFWLGRYGWMKAWKGFTTLNLSLFFIFSLAMQFFCFSFAGLLFLLFSLIYLFYRYLHKNWPKWLFRMALVCFPLIPILVYSGNIHIRIEVDEAAKDLGHFIANPESVFQRTDAGFTGNQIRLIMWTVAAQEIIANPWGAGTSNFDDVLGKRLTEKGLPDVAALQYNPHNQFLQVGVELGIFGLLVFLWLLFRFAKYAISKKDYILLFLWLNLVFNMLFESMLQRQSGIVFYTFWFCVLLVVDHFNSKVEDTSEHLLEN